MVKGRRWLGGFAAAALMFGTGCGGGGGEPESAIRVAPTTEAETTTTAEETTTVAEETTTSEVAAGEDAAESILLTVDDLGDGWERRDRFDDPLDYDALNGCDTLEGLMTGAGAITEADSLDFINGDLVVNHSVRVFADESTAADVLASWREETTSTCLADAIQNRLEAGIESGEYRPFTSASTAVAPVTDDGGDASTTRLELTFELTGGGGRLVVVEDLHLIHVGSAVSQLMFRNVDVRWDGAAPVVNQVTELMAAAEAG